MNKIFKNTLLTLAIILSVITVAVVVKAATDLTVPSGALSGGNPVASFKTLEDIYQKLVVGTTAGTPSLSPSAGPAGTMHTTNDIYDNIPANDQVCIGTNGGTATCGGGTTVWATEDITSYDCAWLTTDPAQPAVDLATICGYDTNCAWADGACTGTPTAQTTINWYAGKAACANSTLDGQTAGYWDLPTYPALVDKYLTSNGTPSGFRSGYYWTTTTYPVDSRYAYGVSMYYGHSDFGNKSYPNTYVRCAH